MPLAGTRISLPVELERVKRGVVDQTNNKRLRLPRIRRWVPTNPCVRKYPRINEIRISARPRPAFGFRPDGPPAAYARPPRADGWHHRWPWRATKIGQFPRRVIPRKHTLRLQTIRAPNQLNPRPINDIPADPALKGIHRIGHLSSRGFIPPNTCATSARRQRLKTRLGPHGAAAYARGSLELRTQRR